MLDSYVQNKEPNGDPFRNLITVSEGKTIMENEFNTAIEFARRGVVVKILENESGNIHYVVMIRKNDQDTTQKYFGRRFDWGRKQGSPRYNFGAQWRLHWLN